MSDEIIMIQNLIYEIRGQKVMLDFDLARLYQVETKVLNQAVKRNIKRFPDDFMFQLTVDEAKQMRSQIVTTSRRPISAVPFAFTEQGVAMLSGLLNSDVAIAANIAIMRAFVQVREYLLATSNLSAELKELWAKSRAGTAQIAIPAFGRLPVKPGVTWFPGSDDYPGSDVFTRPGFLLPGRADVRGPGPSR
jgi:hypothetical protein